MANEKQLFKNVILDELGPMNPAFCKFALDLLDKVSEYFWVEPASSTGKHHPEYGLGEGGLARHSLMVYRWLKLLLEANEQDMKDFVPGMVVASLFHDCRKRGPTADGISEHTLFEHPLIAAKFVLDNAEQFAKENKEFIENSIEDEDAFKHNVAVAVSCIETHMGKFNTSKHSEIVLPKPKTPMQYMVHLADYIASRKCTTFDFNAFSKEN
jgi:hypothetical protein